MELDTGRQGRQNSLALNMALVIASSVLWCVVWTINKYLMAATNIAPGIDLVFLPAGFRLLIVIVFGVWGAIGICLADPLMFLVEFGFSSPEEVLVNAVISGFAPFLTMRVFCHFAGIGSSLRQLRPIHLPFLALAVSLVTPLLFNIHFLLTGREQASQFLHNFTAMATGDFLGCLLVSVLARLALGAAKAIAPRSG